MKNLEKEYKDQISHEAPDLWSRIEAGVDAYEAEKAAGTIKATETVTETPKDNITPIRKKNVIAIITRVAAVAACVLILAATAKITRRTKNEAASTSPAEIAFSDSAESPSPSYDTEYERNDDAMAEAEDPAWALEPQTENSAGADSEADARKDYSPTLSPSESAVIKDPVSFDDARDALIPQLKILGFKNITDFVLEDLVLEGDNLTGITNDAELKYSAASFTDTATSEKYLVFYTEINDITEILAVKKYDDTGEFIYTNPVLNK